MGAHSNQLIRGELAFEGAPVDLAGASVRIRLDDVSRADAPAATEAEHMIDALPRGSTSDGTIPFELPVGPLSARSRYNLWVHVDLDGDGQVSGGDFITMESVAVESPATEYHRVRLRRV